MLCLAARFKRPIRLRVWIASKTTYTMMKTRAFCSQIGCVAPRAATCRIITTVCAHLILLMDPGRGRHRSVCSKQGVALRLSQCPWYFLHPRSALPQILQRTDNKAELPPLRAKSLLAIRAMREVMIHQPHRWRLHHHNSYAATCVDTDVPPTQREAEMQMAAQEAEMAAQGPEWHTSAPGGAQELGGKLTGIKQTAVPRCAVRSEWQLWPQKGVMQRKQYHDRRHSSL